MLRKIFCVVSMAAVMATAVAAPVDDAKKLYLAGDYQAAVDILEPLRKKSPRNGNVCYYLGASLVGLGRIADAKAPLVTAEKRGVAEAARLLARIALDAYDVDSADEHLDEYETLLGKKRNADTSELEEMQSRVVMMRNMLQRVESIEIVDSVNVDADEFFTHYRLSPESGRLMTPAEAGVDAVTVVYTPQNRAEMLWAQAGDDGDTVLTGAQILDDGTVDSSAPLAGDFDGVDSPDYPFMMPDGMTLYFAAKGDASLGGYDIFMTRRGEDGFLQPQNIGMPYNSPYDDYMLAIDETTRVGWFASNRSGQDGVVTIYTFIPSETRVNYPADDPRLGSLARIGSIADTQTGAHDYEAFRQRVAQVSEVSSNGSGRMSRFEFVMPDGRVITELSGFTNQQARRTMVEMLSLSTRESRLRAELDTLRERYRRGDRDINDDILDDEAELEHLMSERMSLRNKIIRLESGAR